ncbi:MAG: glutamate--tRNA ligase [Patescibacteria group bacterium]|nr:glutamate--tRNA ligase [Patescibacteria group bacterium]
MVRIRFAPSPTGFLHVGGLRTALYSELFARKHGGVLILRIEDTDQARTVEGGIENIIKTLEWAGIQVDEGPYIDKDGRLAQKGDFGPYIQSERTDIYKEQVEKLLEGGHAYRCFCCTDTLAKMREEQQNEGGRTMYDGRCKNLTENEVAKELEKGTEYVVRLKVPDTGVTAFDDEIRGRIEFSNSQIDDQVLMKSDGFPTYHLANVVDDHLMGVTHVVRGEEWCPSTPKHVLLYEAFGWDKPVFAHVPLLLNTDKSKLSKRQGDVAVEDYRDKGYLRDALINFVALLGWNPTADREIYSKEEMIKAFDLRKINKGGAVFNVEKLDWMNGEYLKKLTDGDLAEAALPFYVDAGVFVVQAGKLISENMGEPLELGYLEQVVPLEKERVKKLSDLPQATDFFFRDLLEYEVDMLPWKKSTADVARVRLRTLVDLLKEMPDKNFKNAEKLGDEVLKYIADRGYTNAETLWPMRVALTASKASPSPFEVAAVLGKERTIARMKHALSML